MNDDPRRTDRLHDALAAVADRHEPDPDAWSRISARLAEDGPVLAEVTTVPVVHRTRHRVLAAVAVVVAVAAIGTAVLVTREDDGSTKVATTTPDDEPTGWYIPVGLPAGWQVTTVTNTRMDEACPCREAVWADADRSKVVIVSRSDAPTDDGMTLDVGPEDRTEFDLGPGVTATRTGPTRGDNPVDARDDWMVEWDVDGQRTGVQVNGLDPSAAEPLARALYADPATDQIPVSGVSLLDEWNEDGSTGRDVQLDVTMQAPSGNTVTYTLSAPHHAVGIAWSYEPTDRLPGQPLKTLVDESGGPQPEGSDFPDLPLMHDYLGRWPGATVRSAGFREGTEGSDEVKPTDAEVETLMASLRPATTQEWRRFVARAGNRDRTVTASATLADLIDGVTAPVPAEVTSTTSAEEAATTEAGNTTTTGAAGSLADLELSLSAEPRLATWEDANVVLTVRNPTASAIADPGCILDGAEVALLPADAATSAAVEAIPAGDPWWSDDGACDGGMTIEPGASKSIRLVTRAQFHDSRYGPLPAGSYEATVRIAGIDPPTPAPVVVGGETCTGGGVEDYIGLTEAEAYALGGERVVSQVRVPEPGSESEVAHDGERCDRINLILGDDGRVVYARAY